MDSLWALLFAAGGVALFLVSDQLNHFADKHPVESRASILLTLAALGVLVLAIGTFIWAFALFADVIVS